MRHALIVAIAFAAGTAPAADRLPAPASAEVCGDCHRAIAEGWKHSAHAAAMESRLFQDSLKAAGEEFGPEARKVCIGCHAPVAALVGDWALDRKVSWEGVTCDYCHSIREVVETPAAFKARVEFSQLKSGPSRGTDSPAHATAYSAVHTSALTCAVCHEYRNPQGFAVIDTYEEWKRSPAGKADQACQICHMYLVKGAVVDPRVKRDASHMLNLHDIPGSHSVEQLNRALKVRMTAVRSGDRVEVTVRLANEGAGHSLPTGSPMRQLILEVRAKPYGEDTLREERILTRKLADADGTILEREHVAFLKAAKVVSDTRLGPGEARSETFSFALPRGKQVRVDAAVYYHHSPTARPELSKRIKFVELTQIVAP